MQYSEAFLIVHQKQIGIHRFFKMKNMSKTKTPNKKHLPSLPSFVNLSQLTGLWPGDWGLTGCPAAGRSWSFGLCGACGRGSQLGSPADGTGVVHRRLFFQVRWGFGDFLGLLGDIFRMDSFGGCTFMYFYFKGKVRFLLDQQQHFKSLKSLRIDFLHFHSFLPQIFQEPGADLLPVRGPSAWGQPSFWAQSTALQQLSSLTGLHNEVPVLYDCGWNWSRLWLQAQVHLQNSLLDEDFHIVQFFHIIYTPGSTKIAMENVPKHETYSIAMLFARG